MESPSQGAWEGWTIFTGMVLALSGVEAVANMTGVMRPDPDSSPDKPSVHHQARKAIGLVMIEVCLITAILGLMIAGMPKESFLHPESFLRTMADHYIGPTYAWVVGVVVGLLLLSAVNTAIVASVALLFSMAQDGYLPPAFRMLNRQGVPWVPLIAAVVLPVVVLESARGLEALGSLYAIGVTGAIGLNLGSCSLDRSLVMKGWQRAVMTGTALLMVAIWVTIAVTKPQAFLFAAILAGVGLFLREAAQRRGGEKVEEERIVPLGVKEEAKQDLAEDGGRILVAAHGMTASAKFALQEAKLRGARVYFLFVREVKVAAEVVGRLENDAKALEVMGEMKKAAATEKVALTPVYCTANKASDMIVELAATLGADLVILGGTRRGVLVNLLRGDTVREVSSQLPDEIPLLVVA